MPGGTSATAFFAGAATDALPAYDSVSNTVYIAETADLVQNVAYVCALEAANPRIMRVDLATGGSSTLLNLPVTGRGPAFCCGVY